MYVSHSKLAKADDPPTKEQTISSHADYCKSSPGVDFFEKSQFSFFIDFSIGKIFEKMLVEEKVPEIFIFIDFSIGKFSKIKFAFFMKCVRLWELIAPSSVAGFPSNFV